MTKPSLSSSPLDANLPQLPTDLANRVGKAHSNLGQFLCEARSAVGELQVKQRGHWELFEKSRRFAGYAEAEASWKAAVLKHHAREFGGPTALEKPINPQEAFFFALRVNESLALKIFAPVVCIAAKRGDIGFFLRIAAERRKELRRNSAGWLTHYILSNWLHGFLWLMSDMWGSSYLVRLLNEYRPDQKWTISQENYTKRRQRLKLVSYEVAHEKPIITGLIRGGGFICRPGVDKLGPTSSR